MSDETFTGYTASFRPGGAGYDSPLVVVRGANETDLIDKLGGDEDDELGDVIARYHEKLRRQFDDVVVASTPPGESPSPAPIWNQGPPTASSLSPNPDGTYPPCPHGSRPRKPWTSPKNGKRYLFCTLDRGAPGACPSVTV